MLHGTINAGEIHDSWASVELCKVITTLIHLSTKPVVTSRHVSNLLGSQLGKYFDVLAHRVPCTGQEQRGGWSLKSSPSNLLG